MTNNSKLSGPLAYLFKMTVILIWSEIDGVARLRLQFLINIVLGLVLEWCCLSLFWFGVKLMVLQG